MARLPLIAGVAQAARKQHVTSLVLEPADGEPLTAALAGQYIVLRLRPRPDESPLLRSYSLSGAPSEDRYRISVKPEPHGAAGAYIDTQVQAGDTLKVIRHSTGGALGRSRDRGAAGILYIQPNTSTRTHGSYYP